MSVFITALVGVLTSGIYVAATIQMWRRRGKWAAILPGVTALLYSWLTTLFIWDALGGQATTSDNPLSLALFLLPALIVVQAVVWTRQDDINAQTIVDSVK